MGTADQLLPILEGIALLAVCLALMLASVARARSLRPTVRPAQAYWNEVSRVAFIWAAVTTVLLVSSFVEIEGAPTPLWLVLALIVGVACLVALRLRWHRHGGFREQIAGSPKGRQGAGPTEGR